MIFIAVLFTVLIGCYEQPSPYQFENPYRPPSVEEVLNPYLVHSPEQVAALNEVAEAEEKLRVAGFEFVTEDNSFYLKPSDTTTSNEELLRLFSTLNTVIEKALELHCFQDPNTRRLAEAKRDIAKIHSLRMTVTEIRKKLEQHLQELEEVGIVLSDPIAKRGVPTTRLFVVPKYLFAASKIDGALEERLKTARKTLSDFCHHKELQDLSLFRKYDLEGNLSREIEAINVGVATACLTLPPIDGLLNQLEKSNEYDEAVHYVAQEILNTFDEPLKVKTSLLEEIKNGGLEFPVRPTFEEFRAVVKNRTLAGTLLEECARYLEPLYFAALADQHETLRKRYRDQILDNAHWMDVLVKQGIKSENPYPKLTQKINGLEEELNRLKLQELLQPRVVL